MTTTRVRKGLSVATAALALFIVTLLVLHFVKPRLQLARVEQLRAQLTGDAAKNLKPEERMALGRQLGDAMRTLPADLRDDMRAQGRKRFEERLKQFFKMSPPQRNAFLDEEINRQEAMRKQFEANRGQMQRGNNPSSRPTSQEDRERRRKERLDQTTPEERAMRSQYFEALKQRRQQRGMPAGGFGPFGR
jgi:cell division protein FtsN